MTNQQQGYWYLASYPKSGNTWCRVFITELLRLAGEEPSEELNLNRDVETGAIASSRLWLDDQLGINSCDLSFAELDGLRGRAGESEWLFAEGERFHKVHDAFQSPDSRGRPVVGTAGCRGVVYILRHPEDVVVSLSHFFSWPLGRCVEFLLDPSAALVPGERQGGHQVRQHMGRWDQHVRSWVDQEQLPVLVMRYEDMLNKGPETFHALAEFLHLPAGPSLVEQALANTAIDRLQKLEDLGGGFSEKPKGCERFFRSGRTGEGAEQLQPEQRERLATSLAKMMERFNYEGARVIDREPECVLGCVDNQLRSELQAFWRQHQEPFQAELKSFRALHAGSAALFSQPKRPLSRHPAVIFRDETGSIIGIVFVALREIDPSLNLGTHAYFQRMYIVPGSRCCKLANRLFRLFLYEFDKAANWRDHRAKVLLSENVNPGLHKASMRRYFARLGFRMLGANQLGGEVWLRQLEVRFVF